MGVAQSIADGQGHVRRAQLGQHRAVPEFHQGVDDAPAVDHRLHLLQGQLIEPHGLDELQALIHQGGAVDGDLGPHVPVGVLESVLRAHFFQLLIAFAIEGATAAGEPQAADLAAVPAALEALENGAVLGVYGHDLRPAAAGGLHHQLPGADQGLLVGQGDAPAQGDGGQGGLQANGPHQTGDHGVGLRRGGGPAQALPTGEHLCVQVAYPPAQRIRCVFIIKHSKARAKLPHLLFHDIHISSGGQSRRGKAQLPGRLEGLCADGAGGAQHGDDLAHSSIPQ